MSGQIDLDRKTTPVKEPAKGWRNKWRVPANAQHADGQIVGPGIHWGKEVFPTREVAEHAANLIAADNAAECGHYPTPEWLGAFPVTS